MPEELPPIRTSLEPQAVGRARELLQRTGEHPVVSVYFDLNPAEFATGAARDTQIHSLLDSARRESFPGAPLSHAERKQLEEDLGRVQGFLGSGQAPVSGALGLAVFCSGGDGLFEVIPLTVPVQSKLVIARTPYVEPLVAGHDPGRWCVALVNRRAARVFEGDAAHLAEALELTDARVHTHIRQGGLSQARYQRSGEEEADEHLRHVAGELHHRWQRRPFSTLIIGGPHELMPRFEKALHRDLQRALGSSHLDLDISAVTETEVRRRARALLGDVQESAQRELLENLAARVGRHDGAVVELAGTLGALAERRVHTLVLAAGFTAGGGRCPACGSLYPPEQGKFCPADETHLQGTPDLREAMIEAAVLQDAEVIVLEDPPPGPEPAGGVGAVLRF